MLLQVLLKDSESKVFILDIFYNLKIDPKKIDINIHPTKTEIKFEEEQNIYAVIRSAVKHSLGIFQVIAYFRL